MKQMMRLFLVVAIVGGAFYWLHQMTRRLTDSDIDFIVNIPTPVLALDGKSYSAEGANVVKQDAQQKKQQTNEKK